MTFEEHIDFNTFYLVILRKTGHLERTDSVFVELTKKGGGHDRGRIF
jgi:hypothetical protein